MVVGVWLRREVVEEEVEERACLDLCSLVVFEELVSLDNLPFYLIHLSSRSVFILI